MVWQDPRWAWLPSRPAAALPVLCGVPALPSPPSFKTPPGSRFVVSCRVALSHPCPVTSGLRGAACAQRRPSWDTSIPEKRVLIFSSPALPPCSPCPVCRTCNISIELVSCPCVWDNPWSRCLLVLWLFCFLGFFFPLETLFILNKLGQPMRFPLVSSPPSRGPFALGLKGGGNARTC